MHLISTSLFLHLLLAVTVVFGHPGEVHVQMPRAEIARRQLAASQRHLAALSCASSIQDFQAQRVAKRALLKKRDASSQDVPSLTISTAAPHYSTIQDSVCVTAPEIEEGPYYVNNEYVRQDLREEQKGVTLILDVGVVDTSTCTPLSNAFVELWNANATGFYGAFESTPPGAPPGPPTPIPGPTDTAPPGLPQGGYASPAMTSNATFLRGGVPTAEGGVAELTTLFPGFYPGRTVHIHLMVHTRWAAATNGTLLSHAGALNHVGQLFFDEAWNDRVLRTSHYSGNTHRRTRNVEDHDFGRANADGNSAVIRLEQLTEDISDGLLGYITVGIDTRAEYAIHSTNYHSATDEAT